MAPVALITGASGLIGRHVLQQWDADGLRPQVVDHARDDLLVPGVPAAVVQRLRPAVVVHLAWAASGTPGYRQSPDNERWVRVARVARACRRRPPLVATGTSLDRVTAPADATPRPRPGSGRSWRPRSPRARSPGCVPTTCSIQSAGAPRSWNMRSRLATRANPSCYAHPRAARFHSRRRCRGRDRVTARHALRGELPIGSGRLRRVADLVSALGGEWISDDPQLGAGASQLHETADTRRLRELGWTPVRTDELFARA